MREYTEQERALAALNHIDLDAENTAEAPLKLSADTQQRIEELENALELLLKGATE